MIDHKWLDSLQQTFCKMHFSWRLSLVLPSLWITPWSVYVYVLLLTAFTKCQMTKCSLIYQLQQKNEDFGLMFVTGGDSLSLVFSSCHIKSNASRDMKIIWHPLNSASLLVYNCSNMFIFIANTRLRKWTNIFLHFKTSCHTKSRRFCRMTQLSYNPKQPILILKHCGKQQHV